MRYETSRIIALHFFFFPFFYFTSLIAIYLRVKSDAIFFFGRPPRRTTRFTDRNEQPAVKVDVESRPPHVSSSRRSAFHRPATRWRTLGEENSPSSGEKKTIEAGREPVKKRKKEKKTRTPARFPVCQKPWKKGGKEEEKRRRNSRSVIFIRALACLFARLLARRFSKDILFSWREK